MSENSALKAPCRRRIPFRKTLFVAISALKLVGAFARAARKLRCRTMAASPYGTARGRALDIVPWHIPWHWLHQSAVCEQMNVWPSMPMYVVSYGVATVVGTWYWCDGVWIGFKHDGELLATDWLA